MGLVSGLFKESKATYNPVDELTFKIFLDFPTSFSISARSSAS